MDGEGTAATDQSCGMQVIKRSSVKKQEKRSKLKARLLPALLHSGTVTVVAIAHVCYRERRLAGGERTAIAPGERRMTLAL